MADHPRRHRHSQQLTDAERQRQHSKYGFTAEDAHQRSIDYSIFRCYPCGGRKLDASEHDVCKKCGKRASRVAH